jgi:hypothetical protein
VRERVEIPVDGLDTPSGRLYRPRPQLQQISVLVGTFAGGPLIGWTAARFIGDLSEDASALLWLPFSLIFFLGYAVWLSRLGAIVFDTIGRSVLRALFVWLVRRRRPDPARDVLPSRDALLAMLVRAQKAGASFAPVGWLIAPAAGLGAAVVTSRQSPSGRFLLIAVTCVAWGHLLAWLGRRGWLPFPEDA